MMLAWFRILEMRVTHLKTFEELFQAFDISAEEFGWLAFIPPAPKNSLRNIGHETGACVKQFH